MTAHTAPPSTITTSSSADALALRLMALGFGVGSLLFAVGAVLTALRSGAANATFAVGAVCFTSAAFVQWRTAVHHGLHGLRQRAEFDLTNPDWTSAVAQLVGTLYFNVMTIRALTVSLVDPQDYDHEVWRPDVLGSALFLISSLIALHPVARARRHRLIPERAWLIACSNLAGSILFAVSAIGAWEISAGLLLSTALNNLGTFLGAIGFLTASVLLWPPRQVPGGASPSRDAP
jgi:hypothetical protein